MTVKAERATLTVLLAGGGLLSLVAHFHDRIGWSLAADRSSLATLVSSAIIVAPFVLQLGYVGWITLLRRRRRGHASYDQAWFFVALMSLMLCPPWQSVAPAATQWARWLVQHGPHPVFFAAALLVLHTVLGLSGRVYSKVKLT